VFVLIRFESAGAQEGCVCIVLFANAREMESPSLVYPAGRGGKLRVHSQVILV